MLKHRLFYALIVLVLLMSFALAACASQNELTPESPTAVVATDLLKPSETPLSDELTPEVPAATSASASPAPSENPVPLAAWEFDGDGTASVGDSTLEFSGSHAFSDTAVAFDGYTGHASTAAPGPIDTTASFSVSAWVNYADKVSESSVAVSQFGEESYAFALGVSPTGPWRFTMKIEDRTGGQYAVWTDGPQAVPSKSWTHLVGVYDNDTGMLHLYVNGESQAETPFNAPFKANGPLTIGSAQFDSHPGNFWPGSVREVAVYQTALTAEQVAKIYQTTKPSSPPPPMPAPDPSTYANGILNGTWDYVLTEEDKASYQTEANLEAESGYQVDELRFRIAFDNHEWWQGFVFDGELWKKNGVPEIGDSGTFFIVDDRLMMVGNHGQTQVAYAWVLDGDQLTLTVVEECDIKPTGLNCRDDRSQMDQIMIYVTEHTYTKSGDDGSYLGQEQ